MEKIGIISGKGGTGKSTLSKYISEVLSKNQRVLLIDSDFGFRTLDLMLDLENTIYDIYDYSKDLDDDLCINDVENNENLKFICASQSKSVSDIDFNMIKEKLEKDNKIYDYLIVDIPRDENTILAWANIVDKFILITEDDDINLRLTDKIMYIFIKNKIKKDINIVFNRVDNKKEFDLEKKYEIFRGPSVKIISKIPVFTDLENSENEEYLLFINDIINALKGEEVVFRDKRIEETGFLKKIFGK